MHVSLPEPSCPSRRPDGTYDVGDVSPETLSAVVDFCYAGALPRAPTSPAALAALLRAAHRFLMPALLEACAWVRLAGTIATGDEGVFLVHDAAVQVGHEKTAKLARSGGEMAPRASSLLVLRCLPAWLFPTRAAAFIACGITTHHNDTASFH